MKINWLGTTAIVLLIGTGTSIAQSPPDLPQKRDEGSRALPQKREEAPRAQTPGLPSKEAERPAAGQSRPTDRLEQRAAEPEPKAGAKEPRRGEAPSPAEPKRAEERQPRDMKEPSRQSQEQPARGERPLANPTQQSQEEQKAREAKQPESKQPGEPKRQMGREEQQKQDNRAVDERRPGDTKQQQGQRQPERSQQSAQPSTSQSVQQGARQGETGQDRQRGENTGRAADQSPERGRTSSATVNDDQRRQIAERLRQERSASNENINIRINVGERLPPSVRPRPLPTDIVRIAPQYRDYEYTVIDDRVAIVDPRTREVVDYIEEPGSVAETTSRFDRGRVFITREQREIFRQAAQRTTTVGSNSSSGGSSCLTLQPVPEDLVRSNPELASYRYLAIGDQIVLVDPNQQKIVQLID
ncbi:MAG: putative exported protein of unknown function [Bradyrhizobium sp.]|nr:putative exported protein of unknown function [Bradyrhizobium sp.]